MRLLLIILFTILGIIAANFIYELISLLSSLKNFIKSKIEINDIRKMEKSIVLTENLNSFIMKSIEIEITKHMNSLLALDMDYDVLNLDKDVSNISTRVFNSIKKEFLNNKNIIFTSNFLMQNIIDMTRSFLLTAIKAYSTERNKISEI